jgi:hypothetical protein
MGRRSSSDLRAALRRALEAGRRDVGAERTERLLRDGFWRSPERSEPARVLELRRPDARRTD